MKRLLSCFVFFPVIFVISCGSAPVAEPQPAPVEAPAAAEKPAAAAAPVKEEVVFNPETVSQELYNSTKIEVQKFIEDLNAIIRSGNYNAWKAALSEDLFAEISSPGYLQQISDSDAMKTRKIVLKTPQDYFTNVVVPSRANSRVDYIEFIGENRVKAFTDYTNRQGQVQRLRLYDLEHFGNIWKIIN